MHKQIEKNFYVKFHANSLLMQKSENVLENVVVIDKFGFQYLQSEKIFGKKIGLSPSFPKLLAKWFFSSWGVVVGLPRIQSDK